LFFTLNSHYNNGSSDAPADKEVVVIDLNESLRRAAAFSKQRLLIQIDITKKIWINALTDFWPRWKTNANNVSTSLILSDTLRVALAL
jgi:hypothetical protein